MDANNKNMVLNSLNTVCILSLLGYTIKTFNEMNGNLEELRSEMEYLKETFMDNNKKSNLAFNKLNQKIEENVNNMASNNINLMKKVKKMTKATSVGQEVVKKVEESDSEEEEFFNNKTTARFENRADDISSAIDALMKN